MPYVILGGYMKIRGSVATTFELPHSFLKPVLFNIMDLARTTDQALIARTRRNVQKCGFFRPKTGCFWCCRFVIRIADPVSAGLPAETATSSRIAMIFSPPEVSLSPMYSAVWTRLAIKHV